MKARDDCPFFTFLTDSPDNENVPISGVVPNLQNENYLKGQYHDRYHDFWPKFTKFKL